MSILEKVCDSFYGLFVPYKNRTTHDVDLDVDIENQYERVAKKGVVLTGNVFTNLLVLKVDTLKAIGKLLRLYIKELLEYNNEPTILEDVDSDFEVLPDKKND